MYIYISYIYIYACCLTCRTAGVLLSTPGL